ncbi:hypothetical protein B0J11DRAFT_275736 [Dendryphion nanum]|uniref:Metallo-dependent hydrolase n=1 Tax=Dendryphion nanum TaxID=256645 RepID=A0A9P9IQB3_9PLEO|nr:hypothetical protein B0J11DRAFT_275736 [Dendryphion nanum]
MVTHDDVTRFPWELGIYDSHCHPTDTMSSIPIIKSMKTRVLTVMGTRAQDQELVVSVAQEYGIKSDKAADWKENDRVVPCFGWHPWFSHQMYIRKEEDDVKEGVTAVSIDQTTLQGDEKIKHYQAVLQPHRPDLSDEDRRIYLSLPDPLPFSLFLSETRKRLEAHPFSLVGEIGLDRSFRIPEAWLPEVQDQRDEGLTPGGREGRRLTPFRVDMKHQKTIFKLQLQLAAEMGRAVSIHGVQAHGVLFETLKELYKGHENEVLSKRERKKQGQDNVDAQHGEIYTANEPKPYPPRICLHSYSGNAAHFKQYKNPNIPIDIFASFSSAINLSEEEGGAISKSFEETIKETPDQMLLVESDLHVAGHIMDQHMEDIVRNICHIKGWTLEKGIGILRDNYLRFLFGTDKQ